MKDKMKRYATLLIFISLFQAISCMGHLDSNDKNTFKSDKVNASIEDLYRLAVAHQVMKNWKYSKDLSSTPSLLTSIVFKVMPDGEIKDIYFVKRSGNEALDESAYNAIVKTNPTKPFPPNIQNEYFQMGIKFCPD